MGFWEAILLGIIQGLTEFLPVSSSGHLTLFTAILGKDQLPAENLFFTILLHAATAIATMIVFRKDIVAILSGVFKKDEPETHAFVGYVVVSMIPAVLIGLFFEDQITALFDTNLALLGGMLCLTAAFLFFSDKASSKKQPINYNIALLIGIAQAIAILPGISRSGATIAVALLIGVNRPEAARFSFLMVIPLILGSMTKSILNQGVTITFNIMPMSVGFLAALVSGVLACTWMIALVKHSKLSYFAVYCLVVGITTYVFA
tara:strand:- start:1540 stop:2322 length:783 start_codon:yes stop_codon:yes gene_type:complete